MCNDQKCDINKRHCRWVSNKSLQHGSLESTKWSRMFTSNCKTWCSQTSHMHCFLHNAGANKQTITSHFLMAQSCIKCQMNANSFGYNDNSLKPFHFIPSTTPHILFVIQHGKILALWQKMSRQIQTSVHHWASYLCKCCIELRREEQWFITSTADNFALHWWASSFYLWWQCQAMQWLHGQCCQAAPWAIWWGHCHCGQFPSGIVAFALQTEVPQF